MIRFNAKGTPYTSIEIYGANVQQAQTFEAIVDTGFDGFVRMPFFYGAFHWV